jgi:hypothetical protein
MGAKILAPCMALRTVAAADEWVHRDRHAVMPGCELMAQHQWRISPWAAAEVAEYVRATYPDEANLYGYLAGSWHGLGPFLELQPPGLSVDECPHGMSP